MQRGYFFHTGQPVSEKGGKGSWHLRFYQKDGTQKCVKLGPWLGDTTPPDSIRAAAATILAPFQQEEERAPEMQRFVDYVDEQYLPVRQREMRPPSYAADCALWKILKPHVPNDLMLCQFAPAHAKAMMEAIHAAKPRSRNTYTRLRSFLNNVLRYAISTGIKGLAVQIAYGKKGAVTTVQLIKLPKGIAPKEKQVYSPDQVVAILGALEEPTRTIVHLAVRTGLRKSEIQGLQWEDLDVDNEQLHIRRTVWFGKNRTPGGLPYSVGETKTASSAAAVPIDTELLEALLRLRPENATGWIFRSRRDGGQHPRHLSNLESTAITPKLESIGVPWLGWHAFRHTFATMLNDEGIDMKTRQALLRHSDPHTTEAVYTHANVEAMRRGSDAVGAKLAKVKK
jgi:integrase